MPGIPEKLRFPSSFSIICLFMRAMQVNNSTQGPTLIASELPQPRPGEGELLIQRPRRGRNPHRAELVSDNSDERRNAAQGGCTRA